jgi:hypothetical protein
MAQQQAVNPHQCVKCGAPVGTGGGRCPFCGTEQPQAGPPSMGGGLSPTAATVGLTDANRARMGRPSIRIAPPKKSPIGTIAVAGIVLVAVVGVAAGGYLWTRNPPPVPTVSAPPLKPKVEPEIIAGIVLTDPQHVDPTDLLPKVRKRVTAWDPEAKLLEIVVTHSKGGWVNVQEPGAEITIRFVSEKRDPRAAKGKEITRERMTFAVKRGAGDPDTGAGVATDKGVGEPNCVWGAAYRAALKSGLPEGGQIDARLGWNAKAGDSVWTFTSGGETRDLDANTCVIRSLK